MKHGAGMFFMFGSFSSTDYHYECVVNFTEHHLALLAVRLLIHNCPHLDTQAHVTCPCCVLLACCDITLSTPSCPC